MLVFLVNIQKNTGLTMFNISSKIEVVKQFLSVLSWEKILQVAVLLVILLLSWAAFENRESIYNFVNQKKLATSNQKNTSLSKKTIEEINSSVTRSNLIIGIQVVIVDFQSNSRTVVHTYADNNELLQAYNRYATSNITQEIPLFNSDESNNNRVIALINGEFLCYEFGDSIGAKYAPETIDYIHTVCSNGIPPFYGRFTGMIAVYLAKKPTVEEIDQVKTLSKRLSSLIYENDLK